MNSRATGLIRASVRGRTNLLGNASMSRSVPLSLVRSNHLRLRPATSSLKAGGTWISSTFHATRNPSRFNSTSTRQDHLYSSFSTPFSQFLSIISRIVRIILFSSLSIVTILAISFESTHQYLEHFKIKNPSVSLDKPDDFGFQFEFSHDSNSNQWTGKPGEYGTDKSLNSKLKHAIRSAWICLNWGTGINPSFFFNSPGSGGLLGPNRIDSYFKNNLPSSESGQGDQEEGLKYAENYLSFVLGKLELEKGIRLPEIGQPFQLNEIDDTCLKLELLLSNVRERLGNKDSILKSILGYEKVFQILIAKHESDRDFQEKGASSKELRSNQKSTLVGMATKIGRLNSELNERDLSEQWLLKAVELSGNGVKRSEIEGKVDSERKSWIPNWFAGKKSENFTSNESTTSTTSTTPTTSTTSTTTSTNSVYPTPALTRSLISALLTLSGLYASSKSDKAELEKALRIQSDAFSICRLEKERLNSLRIGTSDEKELHELWLNLNSSIISLHLAQTIYGLSAISSKSLLDFFKDDGNPIVKSKKWLENALTTSQNVKQSLVTKKISLADKWKGDDAIEVMARRLGRDSLRVEEMANQLLGWLKRKESV